MFDGLTAIAESPGSEGTEGSNPKVFGGTAQKTLTAKSHNGASITGTVYKQSGGAWTPINGGTVSGITPVSINLPALGASENEALYKITLKAQLTGYDDSDEKEFFVKLLRQDVPVLKLKQDFSSGDINLHCISAGTKAYVTEDIIPDAGQYNSSNPLLIYTAPLSSFKLELSASAGTAVKYKLDGGSEQSSSAPAEIAVIGGTVHTLEVWAERGGIAGPPTTVHIKGIGTLNTYSELKNIVKNAPEKGTAFGQYDYNDYIDIRIGADLSASADTEIAVTGGKNLTLSSSIIGTIRTVNANNRGRIFKISGSDSELFLYDIKLTRGNAADGKGGAVCVETGCLFYLDGKSVITPSSGSDANTRGKNDVYLATGAKIMLDNTLSTPEPIVARITPERYNEVDSVLGGGSIMSGTPPNYTRFSITQQDSESAWKIKSDGTLKKISGVINDSDSLAWQKLKEAVQSFPEGSTITINGEIKATNEGSGTDANNGEIVIDKDITIKGETGAALDILNANSDGADSPTAKHRIFKVISGKTLRLENLTLKGGKASGTQNADKCGGAIYAEGATVTIKDCTLTGNTSEKRGGGIVINGSTNNTITNCTFKGNKSLLGGAVCAGKSGGNTSTVTISSGTIGGTGAGEANEAVTDSSGYFGEGGGIFIDKDCTVTLKDGVELIGNTAKNGGGVCTFGGKITMESGAIQSNTASKNGGGVAVLLSSSEFTMNGSAQVHTNNDVYLNDDAKITVDNGLTGTAPVARITVPNEKYQVGTQVLTGGAVNTEHSKFIVTPQTTPSQKWTIDEQGKLQKITGGSASIPTAKWTALKNAVESASDGDVFYIEGEYTMPVGSDTMVPAANCTIRGTNNAVLNADNKGKMITITAPGIENMTLENLTIKNGKDDEFALSAYRFFKFHLKNVTVKDTEKIIKSDSGDVTFENVQALDNNSMIELGGFDTQQGGSDYHYSYLNVKGDTEIKGTVKLVFPMHTDHFNGAIKICDKKSYTLKLDFKNDSNNYYNSAENQQVVFLDNSVTGFSLTDTGGTKHNRKTRWR